VEPAPEEIIAGALSALGPAGDAVRVDLPLGLPEVITDAPVAERVIANLTANALRYSPAGKSCLANGAGLAVILSYDNR
jgi:two-component system, OmpR family, sensor histidine kinase KdpD